MIFATTTIIKYLRAVVSLCLCLCVSVYCDYFYCFCWLLLLYLYSPAAVCLSQLFDDFCYSTVVIQSSVKCRGPVGIIVIWYSILVPLLCSYCSQKLVN